MQLIYQDQHVEIFHQPGSDQHAAIITFNNMQMVSTGDSFWGRPVVEKLRLPAIGVMSRARNWFPLSSMQAAAPIVRRHVKGYDRVIAYGASMGGYGALKHGKRFGATHAIAFSPQHSIDPEQVHPWDKRYSRYHNRALHGSSMHVRGAEIADHAHIFYDPFLPSDAQHVDHLRSANASVNLHRLFCAGHEAVSLFAGTRNIEMLIAGVVASDPVAIHAFITALRRSHKNRRFHLLKTLMFRRKSHDLAHILLAHQNRLEPNLLAELFAISARYAMYRRDLDGALANIRNAIGIVPDHRTYLNLQREIASRMTAEIAVS